MDTTISASTSEKEPLQTIGQVAGTLKVSEKEYLKMLSILHRQIEISKKKRKEKNNELG